MLRPDSVNSTLFMVCDVQERFEPVMKNFNQVVAVAKRLVQMANELTVDVLVTEQYPRGLGKTSPAIRELVEESNVIEKTKFSMVTPDTQKFFSEKTAVVICGMEAHVCVSQTCFDLLEQGGITVYLLVDGVDSRSSLDKEIALQRLQTAGVVLTTR